MKNLLQKFMGESRCWWVILLAGILMVICGFTYWFWPVAGYAVASQIFGWLLILVGVIQLCSRQVLMPDEAGAGGLPEVS